MQSVSLVNFSVSRCGGYIENRPKNRIDILTETATHYFVIQNIFSLNDGCGKIVHEPEDTVGEMIRGSRCLASQYSRSLDKLVLSKHGSAFPVLRGLRTWFSRFLTQERPLIVVCGIPYRDYTGSIHLEKAKDCDAATPLLFLFLVATATSFELLARQRHATVPVYR